MHSFYVTNTFSSVYNITLINPTALHHSFPLTELLRRVSLTTRGSHRRLDMGRARAYAETVDMAPLLALRDALERALQVGAGGRDSA